MTYENNFGCGRVYEINYDTKKVCLISTKMMLVETKKNDFQVKEKLNLVQDIVIGMWKNDFYVPL